MTKEQVAMVCAYVAANWPAAAMTEGTLDVFRMEIGPLDFDEAIVVLREDFADEPFPPTPMRLRNAVIRRTHPSLSWEAAMDELLTKISSVGRYSPEPEWSDPSIGEVVRQRGGWHEVCASTPSRQAFSGQQASTFNTWAAQFREHYKVSQGRRERDAVHHALDPHPTPELER